MKEKVFGKDIQFFKEKDCFWTAKEINQQPESWRRLADMLDQKKDEITAFMDQVLAVKNLKIITTGAGSSAFIGEAMQYMIAEELGQETENIHTTDIISAPSATLFDRPTLLISYARSGESPESCAAIRFAEKKIKNLYHIIIVCDKNSTLAKTGQALPKAIVVDMPEETCDKGFAMTSSVSCMVLATWCIFHYKSAQAYTDYIRKLADSVERQMQSLYDQAMEIAKVDYRRIIWLGSSALKGLAREACVKSMELTDGYVHAGYDAPTGFRHGPKTVINDETLTVHFISNLPCTRQYDIDLMKEMIAEKGKNTIVSVKAASYAQCNTAEDFEVVYEDAKELPENTEMGNYIFSLIFAQLLSMHKSLEKGFTTDHPCAGGQVNRVVQGIIIYEI